MTLDGTTTPSKQLGKGGRVNKSSKSATINTKLPLSRVKKIVKMDEDVIAISNAAALVISGATEMFAAYFAEQTFFFTLAEKKKGIGYKHCASAVARLPQLDFLADVVPQKQANTDQSTSTRRQANKSREDTATSSSIPEWARAHPEALAKIQAAQKDYNENPQDARMEASNDGPERSIEHMVSDARQLDAQQIEDTEHNDDIINPDQSNTAKEDAQTPSQPNRTADEDSEMLDS